MSSAISPDLTQRPPRSPRVRLGGYVLLPRIIDKARASLAGKLGEYRFAGTGMDRHFFNFVGLTHEALKAEVAKGLGDGEILNWVNANAKTPRQPWEIIAWSQYHERRNPDSDAETISDFATMVGKHTTTREDITTWFDMLDLDDYCTFGGKP
jgi:hypothetical protein